MNGHFFSKKYYDFSFEKENSIYYGNKVITDISIKNYTQSSTNRTRQQIINVCYELFKNIE